jgi:rhodanese-related sulfurtransferase
MTMKDQLNATPASQRRVPWNRGKLTGAKPPASTKTRLVDPDETPDRRPHSRPRHVQSDLILRRARLVDTERRGKHVLYRLAGNTEVVELLRALGRVGERNVAEVGRVMTDYFHARDALEAVSRKDLISRLRDGLVTVLDVRPEDEFALGHLPGALNIPLGKLEHRLSELPAGREVIAYCRGPYCVLSFEAVAALRARGYLVRRLEDGYPEWKAGRIPPCGETWK